jgi:hypothetical protein
MGEGYMADFGNIEVDGFVEQRKELEKLMMSNPAMEKKVQGLIRKVLMEVRKHVGDAAKASMKSDPRQAYKAVKTAVYRQILGGSVSILDKRKAGTKFSAYEPPRKLREGQRGGNRVPRSERTNDVMKYAGSDRAFVLRFINQGTQSRTAGTRGGRLGGNRGRIAPRNFFGNRSHLEMEKAAENLTKLIDNLIQEELR